MSAYLAIAENVLRSSRRPMTARAILREAFRQRLVPSHLYGETQHKTLQARLSEDILSRRDHSVFFRTKPGTFFLREFLRDSTIPAEYRQPIKAHRRTRDLIRGWPLSVDAEAARNRLPQGISAAVASFFEGLEASAVQYRPYRETTSNIPVWALGFVRRGNQILCYRTGKYRDKRESFAHKRSLTFSALVVESDNTLFDEGVLGIESSALNAVSIDLDIPTSYGGYGMRDFVTKICGVAHYQDDSVSASILVFVEVQSPEWFEPVTKRLSLNDLQWISLSPPPNNIHDFDPWSQKLIAFCSRQSRLEKRYG